MTNELHSEQIKARLLILMLVVILSIIFIALPQILESKRYYQQSQQTLVDIQNLRVFAELSNKISRERAPANKAMSSDISNLAINLNALQKYRIEVDQQMDLTVTMLEKSGFYQLAQQVDVELRSDLQSARHQVDRYIHADQRTTTQMNAAIFSMFGAWDSCRNIFQQLIAAAKKNNTSVNDFASIVLLLADLRDQAGRVASTIMAPLSAQQKIPEENHLSSLLAQEQAKYLWRLMDSMQPEQLKTPQYIELHKNVEANFLGQGLSAVNRLISESQHNQTYFLTPNQLTEYMVSRFSSVVDLQTYLLEAHALNARHNIHIAQRKFFLTLFISILSLGVAIFIMIYTRKNLFEPLIQARNSIVALSSQADLGQELNNLARHDGKESLSEAIESLKNMLIQRDAFEEQLKNMANTDRLTGVSNRTALDAYLKDMEMQPQRFQTLNLIVVDIDNFKAVNDCYGHFFGDEVIVAISSCLKNNVAHSDLIIRFGGDEFLILLEKTHTDWIIQIAESILADVSALEFDLPSKVESNEKLKVSVSIGIASGAESWQALFMKADQSLFKAKAGGRNRLIV